jgi:hypothetical protein
VFQEIYYRDYEDIDGLKCPKKLLINNDGKKLMDGEIIEYTFVDKIEDKEFEKPDAN